MLGLSLEKILLSPQTFNDFSKKQTPQIKCLDKVSATALNIIENPVNNFYNESSDAEIKKIIEDDFFDLQQSISPTMLDVPIIQIETPVSNISTLLLKTYALPICTISQPFPLFSTFFGEEYVLQIMSFYKLTNDDALNYQVFNAFVVGLLANLNYDALEHIYDNFYSFFNDVFHFPFNEFPDNFSQLSSDQAADFLFFIRKNANEFSSLFVNDNSSIQKDYKLNHSVLLQTLKDQAFIDACLMEHEYSIFGDNDTSPLKPLKQRYGYTEYESRDLLYALFHYASTKFVSGTLFSINCRKQSFKRSLKQILPLIDDVGLHGVAIIPTQKDSFERSGCIQIVFRGTYDKASAWRSSELSNPGGALFELKSNALIAAFCDAYRMTCSLMPLHIKNRYLTIELLGHSLAAADAQRMCALIAQSYASTSYDVKIKSLHLYAWNSPGVSYNIAANFIASMRSLKELQHIIKAHLVFFKTQGDFFHRGGQAPLGYIENPSDLPDNIKVTTIKFIHEGDIAGYHSVHCLTHSYIEDQCFPKRANAIKLADIRSNDYRQIVLLQKILPNVVCSTIPNDPHETARAVDTKRTSWVNYWYTVPLRRYKIPTSN